MRLALYVFICLAGGTASWGQGPKLVHVLKGHDSSVRVIVFSPDSKLLASSQDGSEVRLWDVSSGKNLGILSKDGDCYGALAFSPDGKLLAGGVFSCRSATLWNVAKRTKTGIVRSDFRFPISWPAIAFQPGGKTLVWRSCDSDDFDSDKNKITFTDVASLKNTGAVKVKIGRYGCMAFSPDCRLFAIGSCFRGVVGRDVIELYEIATGKKLLTLQGRGSSTMDIAFSPNGKMLAAAIDETVKLWDAATGKHISTFTISNPIVTVPGVKGSFSQIVYGVAFSPDGKTIAFGNSFIPVVELWDVATCKKINVLRGNPLGIGDGIDSIAFSPNGKLLAVGRSTGSGNWDETIELWTLRGQE